MSKFTFTYEGTPAPGQHTKNTVEFNAVTVGDILREVEKFLLGLGYVLPKDTHIGYEGYGYRECIENWITEVSD